MWRGARWTVPAAPGPACWSLCLVEASPRLPPPQVRAFLQPPMKGVVMETFGSGNGPTKPDLLQELRAAAERGLVIVNCTHCLQGAVTSDYGAGVVGAVGGAPGAGAGASPGRQPPSRSTCAPQALSGAGTVPGFDMTSEAALAKLSYVLGLPGLSLDGRKEVRVPPRPSARVRWVGPARGGVCLGFAGRLEVAPTTRHLPQTPHRPTTPHSLREPHTFSGSPRSALLSGYHHPGASPAGPLRWAEATRAQGDPELEAGGWAELLWGPGWVRLWASGRSLMEAFHPLLGVGGAWPAWWVWTAGSRPW